MLAQRAEDFERETLLAELKRHNHHVTNTAKALGLERSHLYKKCQQLGIDWDLRSRQSGRRDGTPTPRHYSIAITISPNRGTDASDETRGESYCRPRRAHSCAKETEDAIASVRDDGEKQKTNWGPGTRGD